MRHVFMFTKVYIGTRSVLLWESQPINEQVVKG
jgi:hypothetical protein